MNVFVNCLITLLVIISDEKITCKSISDNAISAAAVTKNKKCIEFSTNNDPITAIKAPSEQIHNDIIMFGELLLIFKYLIISIIINNL